MRSSNAVLAQKYYLLWNVELYVSLDTVDTVEKTLQTRMKICRSLGRITADSFTYECQYYAIHSPSEIMPLLLQSYRPYMKGWLQQESPRTLYMERLLLPIRPEHLTKLYQECRRPLYYSEFSRTDSGEKRDISLG